MIVRVPRDRRRPAAEVARAVCDECGYATQAGAYCRRCGAPQQSPTVPHVATPSLQGWEGLRRPNALRLIKISERRTRRPRRAVPAPADELSARRTVTWEQVVVLRVLAVAVVFGLIISITGTLTLLIAAATAFYVGAFVYRISAFARALGSPAELLITDEEARGLWEHSLPTYTVLVPAYHEPEVIGQLIARLEAIEYPRDRLDVKLLLEEDDEATIRAAEAAVRGRYMEIVRVPYSEPRTKPKALNLGLSLARGQPGRGLVTIYDAEDRPDPLQLRRAVAAFRRVDRSVACLQAKLGYYNADQNIITRWFTVEYAMWFSQLLPGLIQQSAPLPLGGTSNHFRRSVLEGIGGWDPYNVTEDADLGIRLHRAGYRTRVLASTTLEEANSDFVNWVKQRSRWYKGYMQTWLVHMRHPVSLWRDLGTSGFVGFNLFVGGTPLLALLNPVFWALTALWFIARPEFIVALFPAWLYYLSLLCLVFGNFAFVYMSMVSARTTDAPKLVLAAAVSPAYWVMMSIAAIKALIQLFHAPSFWEKTFHGLDQPMSPEVKERAAA